MAPTTNVASTPTSNLDTKMQKYAKMTEVEVGKQLGGPGGPPRHCVLYNRTGGELLIHEGEYRSFIWSDHEDPFPEVVCVLEGNQHTIVQYQGGLFPENFKGAVCYVDGRDSESRKWIFAFDLAAKKVWAEASPIGPVNWDIVEVRLNESIPGNNVISIDPIRKGVIVANLSYGIMPLAGFHIDN